MQAINGWKRYARHTVFLCSIAYALLYLTVLAPGTLVTSYLIYWQVEQWQIAAWSGLCAVTGMGAAYVTPWVVKRLGTVRAGVVFIWFQTVTLFPAVALSFSPGYFPMAGALYGFMAMIIVSRMGLWGFDLVEVQGGAHKRFHSPLPHTHVSTRHLLFFLFAQ